MSLLTLINRSVCPPNGFRYRFPETGWINHAWDHNTWADQGLQHAKINELGVDPLLTAKMEHQLCLTLPPGWCLYDDNNRPRPKVDLDWGDIRNGISTFSAWLSKGAQFVDQTESNRRALICSKCYLNVHIDGCSACQAAVQKIVKDKSTKHDSFLRGCAVCRCLLKAKVHFPIDVLKENFENQEVYPDFCWLKEGGPN